MDTIEVCCKCGAYLKFDVDGKADADRIFHAWSEIHSGSEHQVCTKEEFDAREK
jgi:hypothetical protein